MLEEQILVVNSLNEDEQYKLITQYCPGTNLSDAKIYHLEKIYNSKFSPEGIEYLLIQNFNFMKV
jgi:hypothetical protein